MLNAAVIGSAARSEQIALWIKQYCNSVNISADVELFRNAGDTIGSGLTPGIVFICTGGAEGFLDARQIRDADKNCRIVFVDSTDEYVIKGIRLHFSDYIVCPVEFKHIVRAMRLCGVGDSR